MTIEHIPVLLNEVIEGLNIKPDGLYVDCTMGGAGHASEIIRKLSDNGHLYCFDQDDYAICRGNEKLSSIKTNYTIIRDNFIGIKNDLKDLGVEKVDGILYDLGVSSFQFDIIDRGFSYNNEAILDMRMDQKQELKAYDIVNYYSFEEIRNILYTYGEEKFSSNIARQICKERITKPIETTLELVETVKRALPAKVKREKGHPAKQTFQALRIAVNDELKVFENSLKDALTLLNKGGRICVITFHSLEDRICKQIFKNVTTDNTPRGLPIKSSEIKFEYKLINNKVIIPSEEELLLNNRAHSAKLRIIEKI